MGNQNTEKPKPGYFMATYNITNHKLFAEYQELALPMLEKYEYEVVALTEWKIGMITEKENWDMYVILKFPSLGKAREWYFSDEYQRIIIMREKSTEGFAGIVEGV